MKNKRALKLFISILLISYPQVGWAQKPGVDSEISKRLYNAQIQMDLLKEGLERKDDQIDELFEKNKVLQNEIRSLKLQIRSAEEAFEKKTSYQEAKLKDQESTIVFLMNKREQLENSSRDLNKSVQSIQKDNDQTRKQFKDLTKERDEMETQLKKAQTAHKQVVQLQRDLSNQQNRFEKDMAESERNWKKRIDELESELEKSRINVSHLEETNQSLLNDLKDKVAVKKELEQAKNQLDEFKRNEANVIAQAKSELITRLDNSQKNLFETQKILSDVTADNQKLKDQLDQIPILKSKNEALMEELQKTERLTESQLKEIKLEYKEKMVALEKSSSNKQVEIKNLSDQNHQLKKSNEDKQKEINKLNDLVKKLTNDYQGVQSQLESVEKDNQKLGSTLTELKEKNVSLNQAVIEKDQTLNQLTDEKDRMAADLQNKIIELEKQNVRFQNEKHEAYQQVTGARAELDRLRGSLEEQLRLNEEQWNKKLSDERLLSSKLEEQVDRLQQSVSTLTEEKRSIQRSFEGQLTQNKNIYEEEIALLEELLHKKEINEVERIRLIDSLQERITMLEKQLSQTQNNNSILTEELARLNQTLQEQKRSLQPPALQQQQMEALLKPLRENIQDLQFKLESAYEDLAANELQIRELVNQRDTLRSSLSQDQFNVLKKQGVFEER